MDPLLKSRSSESTGNAAAELALTHPQAGLVTLEEESSLRQVWWTADMSMKTDQGERTLKTSKMKVDSDKLLKTNREICDIMSRADELLKMNDLSNLPMSHCKCKR
jgi:hypothetical protein